ncbi:dynactin subunit 5, putative [Plasmodium sp. DRC-Itaito]|nr:dynactin subunit 5, putative [Plasmodium sp. DRC-Itaito]
MSGVREIGMGLENIISDNYLECYNNKTFQKAERFNRSDYILTASGNKVSKDSILYGMRNIHMLGKSIIKNRAVLRGDLNSLYIGKYVIIGCDTLICPCFINKMNKSNEISDNNNNNNNNNNSNNNKMEGEKSESSSYITITIGNYVYIGNKCIIKAKYIGNNVYIGNNSIIGERVIIKDNVIIKQNTVIPNDTIISPFSKYSGSPSKFIKNLPDSSEIYLKDISYFYYTNFLPNLENA